MFKPTLAATPSSYDNFQFPLAATPKLDGIRALTIQNDLVSRTMKTIPNEHIRTSLLSSGIKLHGLDGEIITYENGKMQPLNVVSGNVMRRAGKPDFVYHVFDDFTDANAHYIDRVNSHLAELEETGIVRRVMPTIIENADDLWVYESEHLNAGYEGVMVRRLDGHYKYGRATERDRILTKIKRFFDAEGEIIGFIELLRNENEAQKDAFGRTKRSLSKEGRTAGGMLGALVVKTSISGRTMEFEIGTGFTSADRQEIWDNQESYMGKTVTFKYREVLKDKPTLTSFRCIREDL